MKATKMFRDYSDPNNDPVFSEVRQKLWGCPALASKSSLSMCNYLDATLLDDTCCVRLHTLLHVVGSCYTKFETGQTFSFMQSDATIPNNVASVCAGLNSLSL